MPISNAPVTLTERQWLQVKLSIHSNAARGPEHSESFLIEADGTIRCRVWDKAVDRLLEKKSTREEQSFFYLSWVKAIKIQLRQLIDQLPESSRAFDPEADLLVEIVEDYGKGAILVCTIAGPRIDWK